MNKTALVLATAGALALGTVGTTSPAEAHWRGGGWGWGPGIAAGLIGAAVIGGLASSAYAYGPGYGYYGGYAPAYYGGYGGYGYAPYAYAPAYTSYAYYRPAYGYRYHRVFRPAYAYYGRPHWGGHRYHGWHHRRW